MTITIRGLPKTSTIQDNVYTGGFEALISGNGIPYIPPPTLVDLFKSVTITDTTPGPMVTAQIHLQGTGWLNDPTGALTKIFGTPDSGDYDTTATLTPAALSAVLRGISVDAAAINSMPNQDSNTIDIYMRVFEGGQQPFNNLFAVPGVASAYATTSILEVPFAPKPTPPPTLVGALPPAAPAPPAPALPAAPTGTHWTDPLSPADRMQFLSYPGSGCPQDALVDAAYYLKSNPDVAAAGLSATQHYENWGWTEGRDPDPLFDTKFYLAERPDVAAAGMDLMLHYEQYGWREGSDPSAAFSGSQYLAHNPDVAAAGMNPLVHFLEYGQNEGRLIYHV